MHFFSICSSNYIAFININQIYSHTNTVSRKTKCQSVNDVHTVHLSLIIVVIVAPEKRKGITFVQHSCTIEMLSLKSQIEGFVTSTEQAIG